MLPSVPRVAVLLAAFLLVAATACGDEVPVVANGEVPSAGVLTAHLEELWRIGGEDDEENLLGVIDQVEVDDQGNVYLLDVQLVEVQVFDADGAYLKSLGRRGDGPGEVRFASAFLFLPNGNLGLVQGFPGRIVMLDPDGVTAGEIRPGGDDPTDGGFLALRGAAAVGNRLVLSGMRMTRGDNSRTADHFIASYGDDGSVGEVFLGATTVREFRSAEISEAEEFFPHRGGWALGPDGRVVIAPLRNTYRLEVHAPDGGVERVITRPYRSWERTAAEMARAQEMLMPSRRRSRRNIGLDMAPTEKDILEVQIDGDGRIWVLPSRGVREQPAGVHSTWDVFDPAGNFTHQVAIACEGRGLQDALFLPGDGLAVLVREHAAAMFAFRGQGADDPDADTEEAPIRPLEVICYRLSLE